MKRLICGLALAVGVALLVVASAAGDVPRYQMQQATLTADVMSGTYVHTYNVVLNPCDGTFVGTGGIDGWLHEHIAGTVTGTTVTFHATYDGQSYSWDYAGGATGTDSAHQTFPVRVTVGPWAAASHWRNHGDFVASMGGGAEAAHSCIGMPMK